MKKILVAMMALTLSALVFVGCENNVDDDMDTGDTTTATSEEDMGDKIDSGMDKASSAVESGMEDMEEDTDMGDETSTTT